MPHFKINLAQPMTIKTDTFEEALAIARRTAPHCGFNGYEFTPDENGEEVKQSQSYAPTKVGDVISINGVPSKVFRVRHDGSVYATPMAQSADYDSERGPTFVHRRDEDGRRIPLREDPSTVVQGDPEGELIRVLDGQVHPDDADKYEAAMQRAHRAIAVDFYTKPKAELLGMELSEGHQAILEDARTEFPAAVYAAPETIRIGDVVLSRANCYPGLSAGRHGWFAAPITSMPYLLGLLEISETNGGVLIVRGHRSKTAKLHRIELTKDDLAKMAPMDIQGAQDMLDAKHGPGKYLVTSWDRVDYAQATPAWDHPEYASAFDALNRSPEEREQLKLRSTLMRRLRAHMSNQGWTVAEAADYFCVPRSQVLDLLLGRVSEFSMEDLSEMLGAVGLEK